MNSLGIQTRNGHTMELQLWHGMGGEMEDIVVWCHTCDPSGSEVKTFDLSTMTPLNAVHEASAFARAHAEGEK